MDVRIHPTAEVSPGATLGDGVRIWNHCQVREGARIGNGCILSKDVYVDAGVVIGDHCKIQNGISIYHGVTLEDGVFLGPHMVFTNDLRPRAINPDGSLKSATDWALSETRIGRGASIGAGAVIVCGVSRSAPGPWWGPARSSPATCPRTAWSTATRRVCTATSARPATR